jgi:3-oxoacyl-[acyl-carrier-protein] synthase II
VSAFGLGEPALWQGCLAAGDLSRPIPESWSVYYPPRSKTWAPLPAIDWSEEGFSRAEQVAQNQSTLLALSAAREARTMARWEKTLTGDPFRTGTFVGTGLGNARAPFDNYRAHLLGHVRKNLTELSQVSPHGGALHQLLNDLSQHPRVNPLVICQTMPNAVAAALSIDSGAQGTCETACYACASGTVAIGNAYRAVASGTLDSAIAVGVDHLSDSAGGVFMGFDRLQTLATPRVKQGTENRPFDRDRTGFLFSEGGAGAIFMESEEEMTRRAARPLAEISGFAQTSDARSMVAISTETGAQRAMYRMALEEASITPTAIDYINSHGTGTVMNDEIESHLITTIFGEQTPVNSTKSILGHSVGASGALEAVVTIRSILEQQVHPCRNLENPISCLSFVREPRNERIRYAMTQSFGFGGHNAALIFAKVPI